MKTRRRSVHFQDQLLPALCFDDGVDCENIETSKELGSHICPAPVTFFALDLIHDGCAGIGLPIPRDAYTLEGAIVGADLLDSQIPLAFDKWLDHAMFVRHHLQNGSKIRHLPVVVNFHLPHSRVGRAHLDNSREGISIHQGFRG
eukprot:Skav219841  [mRNA]  locus=scaffold859:359952:368464:- [translate_table: standard]